MPSAVKGQTRTGAGLVEGVDQDLALQRCVVGRIAIGIALELGRQTKQLQQGFGLEGLDRNHVLTHQVMQRFTVLVDRPQQRLRRSRTEHIRAHRLKPQGCVNAGARREGRECRHNDFGTQAHCRRAAQRSWSH